MPPKPHRVLFDRVSAYADEASAYLGRRRRTRRPFARVHIPGGRIVACSAETDQGREIFLAAAEVLDAARDAS